MYDFDNPRETTFAITAGNEGWEIAGPVSQVGGQSFMAEDGDLTVALVTAGAATQTQRCSLLLHSSRIRSLAPGWWRIFLPNRMVERITPVTTEIDRETVTSEFEVEDAWSVVCEPFEQWVLEDHFSLGRPPAEDARESNSWMTSNLTS